MEPVSVPFAELEVIKQGHQKRLWFFGAVEYEDVYRKGWRLQFCYYVVWDAPSGKLKLYTADTWNKEKSLYGQPNSDPS